MMNENIKEMSVSDYVTEFDLEDVIERGHEILGLIEELEEKNIDIGKLPKLWGFIVDALEDFMYEFDCCTKYEVKDDE